MASESTDSTVPPNWTSSSLTVSFCRGVEIGYGSPRLQSDGFGGPRPLIGHWILGLL